MAKNNLPGLVSNLASNAINKFEKKISRNGTVRAGKGFTLFISNEDMNDIIKIIKALEDSGVFIDGKTVKHKIKTEEDIFLGVLLAPLVASVVQQVISSAVKGISERRVRKAGRRYMDNSF